MGQKGGDELVRPGAARALVQALFENGDETLAVARELPRGGRSRARMDGLLSSAAAVEDALRRRLAFYGQLEHTRLLQLERQLDLLDGAVADEVEPLKAAYVEAYARARALTRELDDLRGAGRDRERELDMLRYQVGEIEAAERRAGRGRAPGASTASGRGTPASCSSAPAARSPCWPASPRPPPWTACAWRSASSDEAALLDESLAPLAERLGALTVELDDLAAALRDYIDGLDVDAAAPRRPGAALRQAQGADAQVRRLGRRGARLPRGGAQPGSPPLEEFAADEESLVARVDGGAGRGGRRRRAAERRRGGGSPRRSRARIEEELRGLAMPHADVRASRSRRAATAGTASGRRGADDVEFVFGANPGVPPRPLRETASGGELSRAMLAIRGLVTLGDDVETLIFDEVDTGIGGVTAAALGERLRRLAERRQVLCITHLPQVAAFADRQFAIAKESDVGEGTTETVVRLVDGEERLAELCRMLGAAPDDEAARSHAESLLAKASAAS